MYATLLPTKSFVTGSNLPYSQPSWGSVPKRIHLSRRRSSRTSFDPKKLNSFLKIFMIVKSQPPNILDHLQLKRFRRGQAKRQPVRVRCPSIQEVHLESCIKIQINIINFLITFGKRSSFLFKN